MGCPGLPSSETEIYDPARTKEIDLACQNRKLFPPLRPITQLSGNGNYFGVSFVKAGERCRNNNEDIFNASAWSAQLGHKLYRLFLPDMPSTPLHRERGDS